jgi:hypothetical protein
MQNKKGISAPKVGMQRDSHISQLKQTDYTLGVNINSNNEGGEAINIQNEPSNYYGVKFPEGYKVIGFKNDILQEKTYYLLTNTNVVQSDPHHKRSSIGYVINTKKEDFNKEQTLTDCLDCHNQKNLIGTPLEEIVQNPSQQYVELVHDRCISLSEIEDKGLNFDINFPIKKIEIKQEKLGTTLYWNDWRNYFRYLQVGRLEEAKAKDTFDYLHTVDLACEDPQEAPCLDVSKLLVNPKFSRIVLEPKEEQIGGNLKQGTYEFWAAYCDIFGNELTEYCTNPISIWNENNYVQSQTETDDYTNFAIKIKARNLDKDNFKYYKIAVVERNSVDNNQSVFLAGVYPTTDDIIVYTHSGSTNDDLYSVRGNVSVKQVLDFNTLTAVKPQYKRMKGTMVSDDRLWGFGLEEEDEINIQPVVNLFSGLVKAQTSAVSENLYKSSIATSKYKQYARNEVQPLGIRLLYDNGGYSAVFPFVGRPKTEGEDSIIEEGDKNFDSLNASDNACRTNNRTEKWQIYNTAKLLETAVSSENSSIALPPEDIKKVCKIEIETEIPANSVTIEVEGLTYENLEDYINNTEGENIPGISEYLNATYPEQCQPLFVGDCEAPILTPSTPDLPNPKNLVSEVINEQTIIEYKEDSEYTKSAVTPYFSIYKVDDEEGKKVKDTKFIDNYSPCVGLWVGSAKKDVYFRNMTFKNENFSFYTEVTLIEDISEPTSSLFLQYEGSSTLSDLLQNNDRFSTTILESGFYNKIHNKALFFSVTKYGRDSFVLEVTPNKNYQDTGDLFEVINNTRVRYVIYDKIKNPIQIGGGIFDISQGLLETIDISTFPETFIIALDTKIYSYQTGCDPDVLAYVVAPPRGVFGLYQRNAEPQTVTVSWDSIKMEKQMVYTASCTSYLPKVNDCDPIPFNKYSMAYWESVVEYPDNKQLYDSSTLRITPNDLSTLEEVDRENFKQYYVENITSSGNYELKLDTDFRCKKVRHPKFPDNTVAPFMLDNLTVKSSVIFPMGINFDSKIVKVMLEVAYNNKLITKKQKDSIVGWEIMKGDNSIHKSVISNGIAIDVLKYTKDGDTIHFPNFPFNNLGEHKFIKDPTTKKLIQHPYGGTSNNKFTYFSPDMFLTRTQIPSEMSLQGYMFGSAVIRNELVEEHPKWTLLGDDVYTTAKTLATAELALQIVIDVANATKELAAGIGSTNFGGAIAAGVMAASYGLQGFVKYGQYRYQWLETFRNLGRMDNFAYFQYGVGKLNRFKSIENEDANYLRNLSIKKYLRDGDFKLLDENSGEELTVNNHLREASVFLSTGPHEIEYPQEYSNFDNNKIDSIRSSNTTSSDAKNGQTFRNIANPYISLKNYIPDQWDTVDSIKWLTTNYIFSINENTKDSVIYGGYQVISRFSWRTKTPYFTSNAIKTPDKLPYLYSRTSNIGDSVFYCDYETADNAIFKKGFSIFPDIKSSYNLDEQTGKGDFYLRPPSKFYLFSHGIIDFLVESEINCNFRYSKKDPKDQFYNNQTVSKWLQEVNVPIVYPNTFYYNNTYTFPVSNTGYKKLDRSYDKDIWKKRALKNNAWVWSEKDTNENSVIDPWLVFRPLNFEEDKTNRGKLIDLRSIESEQFLGRYEDQLQLFNQANNVADAINNQTKNLGTGYLYSRPISFKKSDLGFAGTQNTDFVSTPYGHFWVDAKRGRVFNVDQNGGNLEVISESIQGQPSGMKQWFREHLPFKILKYFADVDVDNKYKGLGINMWYDDRNSRVFITKKDYIPIKMDCLNYSEEKGFYTNCGDEQIICPAGYTYDEDSMQCVLNFTTETLCPTGYTYNSTTKTCERTEAIPPLCCSDDAVVIVNPSSLTVQDGDDILITLNSPKAGTTFTWTVLQSGVTGATPGTGAFINNTLTGVGTVTYFITPTYRGCIGNTVEVPVVVEEVAIPCNTGMDVVFVVDYTGSMGAAIEAVKSSISTIANTIETESSSNYRMSLVIFDEYNQAENSRYENSIDYTSLPTSQKYININPTAAKKQVITAMELMQLNNKISFSTQLAKINTSGFLLGNGRNTPEPSDIAIDRVVNHNFAGIFRDEVVKFIVLITDALPSGTDDIYNSVDEVAVRALIPNCVDKGVKVLLMKKDTNSLEVLEELALGTGGVVSPSFSPSAIIETIQNICN